MGHRGRIAFAPTFLVLAGCYEDMGTSVREAAVYRAYAADRVYHCPVPFYDDIGDPSDGFVQVYDGADLVLRLNGVAELTFYATYRRGEDPINWQADTTRVRGSYERDGFVLRFRFDEGYTRSVPMVGELIEGGRLVTAFPDGGNMEFVPLDQKPTGPPEPCDA